MTINEASSLFRGVTSMAARIVLKINQQHKSVSITIKETLELVVWFII